MKSRLDRDQKNTVFRTAVLCSWQKKLNYNYRYVSSFLPVLSFEDALHCSGDFFVPIGPRVDLLLLLTSIVANIWSQPRKLKTDKRVSNHTSNSICINNNMKT